MNELLVPVISKTLKLWQFSWKNEHQLIPAPTLCRWLLCSAALKQAVRLDLLHYFSLQNAFGILNKVGASLTHTHTHNHQQHLPPWKRKIMLPEEIWRLEAQCWNFFTWVSGNKKIQLQRNAIPKAKQYNHSGREVQSNCNSGLQRNRIPKAKQSNTINLGMKY